LSAKLLPRSPVRLLAPVALALSLFLVGFTQAAHAAFPGANGKITFDRYSLDLQGTASGLRGQPNAPSKRAFSRLVVPLFTDQIWTVNPDGSSPANISNSNRLDEYGNWSADGTKIAFDQWDSVDQIWSMNGDGSSQTNLTNNSDVRDDLAAWSPDGTRIAFVRANPDTENDEIWVMNADGSNQHLLVTPDPNQSDENPNWSPDGTKLVFARGNNSDVSQVYVANADGSGTPQNLSNNSDFDADPNWSPDGTKIAFFKDLSDGSGEASQIWVMNADGSSPHMIIGGQNQNDEAPAWSPDGTQITYQQNDVEIIKQIAINDRTVWVANADGSNPHQITSPDSPFEDYEPDWQPVGTPASSASLPVCTTVGSASIHVADPTGFKSALNVHYRVDGGAEQVAPADGSGNVTVALGNGGHTIEFWGGDAAGYQEAAHHTATTAVDTVHQCGPQVGVAGVRRACVAKTFRIRVNVSSAAGAPANVKVFLGKKRVLSTSKTSFTLKINPKKLGRRTKLRIVTTGSNGKVTTLSRTIARCAVAKPRHKTAPRFTG
jgi:Tol biopolymer transport system component